MIWVVGTAEYFFAGDWTGSISLFRRLNLDFLENSESGRYPTSSKELLASIKARLEQIDHFWEKERTKADIEGFILDEGFASLPTPPFSVEEKEQVAKSVHRRKREGSRPL